MENLFKKTVTIDIETSIPFIEFNLMHTITAEELRKWLPVNHETRQPCFACEKHSSITQCHHVVPLKMCAYLLNNGFTNRIENPLVWLCPNCHAYLHQLLNANHINIEKELEPEVVLRLRKLVALGDTIVTKIISNSVEFQVPQIQAVWELIIKTDLPDLKPIQVELLNLMNHLTERMERLHNEYEKLLALDN